jgi:hypothetical protein
MITVIIGYCGPPGHKFLPSLRCSYWFGETESTSLGLASNGITLPPNFTKICPAFLELNTNAEKKHSVYKRNETERGRKTTKLLKKIVCLSVCLSVCPDERNGRDEMWLRTQRFSPAVRISTCFSATSFINRVDMLNRQYSLWWGSGCLRMLKRNVCNSWKQMLRTN